MSIMSTAGYASIYKQPSTELVESIIFTSNGDIRNAVINLHFASQKSLSDLHVPSLSKPTDFHCPFFSSHLDSNSLDVKIVQTTSKTKGNKKNNKFRSLGCDDSITFMHALGRVLNPKCKSNFGFRSLVPITPFSSLQLWIRHQTMAGRLCNIHPNN